MVIGKFKKAVHQGVFGSKAGGTITAKCKKVVFGLNDFGSRQEVGFAPSLSFAIANKEPRNNKLPIFAGPWTDFIVPLAVESVANDHTLIEFFIG